MARTAPKPKADTPKTTAGPTRVAVVGGGLAGLTAASQLAQRGYAVTLYEANDTLGGNLASTEVNGVYHDVYPHMFCDWYANFWNIFHTELRLQRSEEFEARPGVKLLKAGEDYKDLLNATTPEAIAANLQSGVMSVPNMFLLGFTMLDLAATPFNRATSDQLEQLDVNGFIYSRGYSTEKVAKLQNYILMVIWSIQSELTSASSYQDFIKHTLVFPNKSVFAWLLKGSLYEKLIQPFAAKLARAGCEVRTGVTVSNVAIVGGKPVLTIEPAGEGGSMEAPPADHVVMAVPAPALARLVLKGKQGERIVDTLPHLAQLRRLRCEAIPVVDVYFNRKLDNVPAEQVALTGSDCDLTMIDISQLWTDDPNMKDRTALVLAASNGFALASADPLEQGHIMIRKLHDYLPVFEPGTHWGDPDSDIDWKMSHFRSNSENKLFLNEVGSWDCRPKAAYDNLPSVFFAGDFCQTEVDMATIEAAVESGLKAVLALQMQDAKTRGHPLVNPVAIAKHAEVHPDVVLLAAKLALLPLAYGATAWSALEDDQEPKPKGPMAPNAYPMSTYALVLPIAFTLDWWKTAYWLVRKIFADPTAPGAEDPENAPANPLAALAKAIGETTAALESYVAQKAAKADKAPPAGLSSALGDFLHQAWRTAQTGYAAVRPSGPAPADETQPYQRRWRVKP